MLKRDETGVISSKTPDNMANIAGIGNEVDGLYYLPVTLQCEENKGNHTMLMTQDSSTDRDKLLWHSRLGHPSAKSVTTFAHR